MSSVILISGAYGVGKSEFATQWALQNAPCYLADIDILNPYFRPREQAVYLLEQGVKVIGSHVNAHINQDFPALSGDLRGAISSQSTLIIDCAGSEHGLKPLATFRDVLENAELWLVVNLMRPESQVDHLVDMINLFESFLQKKVNGFIHNTHLLDETTFELLCEAQAALEVFSKEQGIPIKVTMIDQKFEAQVRGVISNPILIFNELIHRKIWMSGGTR